MDRQRFLAGLGCMSLGLGCVAAGAVLGGVVPFCLILASRPANLPPPGDAPAYVAMGAGMFGALAGAAIGAVVGTLLGLVVFRRSRDGEG
jgi:hypothetical protein